MRGLDALAAEDISAARDAAQQLRQLDGSDGWVYALIAGAALQVGDAETARRAGQAIAERSGELSRHRRPLAADLIAALRPHPPWDALVH